MKQVSSKRKEKKGTKKKREEWMNDVNMWKKETNRNAGHQGICT